MPQFLKIFRFRPFLAGVCSPPKGAAPRKARLAIVIWNASHDAKTLSTAASDAGPLAPNYVKLQGGTEALESEPRRWRNRRTCL
jgi:hypothetical protein